MALALSPERSSNLLSRLVVADIAPNKGALSPEFRIYVDTMQKIEKEGVTSRKEANEYLQAVEPVSDFSVGSSKHPINALKIFRNLQLEPSY